ncbi:GTP 3',8-cyclase MoaA [Ectothiorhodospira lacustris]|uniref:GTP 3',8-cyclase MoaA n=1 Tax=Ectothiorhodospira lacustris TaxID=2899127 RepID=UPI001EE7F46D|nr:GTP 3',8-cyclase MoaA [Ectothiorhodospira lacustris]MCG5500778.1 GTP 3',8-cyclase MoaA [Ectothiorhodospira lacustris]MCG5509343.1 GTP 3',8-cyclase MoaA [Ectothiorhodospira lacustris]MCG5521397.1 GTP 3',8-cyclase MoaA [Ectothiorhodospira lacustris]
MNPPILPPPLLVDRFGRQVTYLRISVTDRCDFRCVYCMAEEMRFLPRQQLLTLEEITQIAQAFIALGVTKIRLTGGEPLVRRGIMALFEALGALDGLKDLSLTTNGSQLVRHAGDLRAAGVSRVNISLDSLKADRFRRLTRTGNLDQVLAGIEAAMDAGFARIKLNSVILKGRNEDEILDLVNYARIRDLDISFIEEMPLGLIGDHDRAEVHYSSDEVRADIEARHALIPTTEHTGGPSRYYRLDGASIRVGFISPHSHNFCDSCNRVRLTAEGRLLLCLGQEHAVDLKRVIRANPGDRQALQTAIRQSMPIKPWGHEFQLGTQPLIFRHMNRTGG